MKKRRWVRAALLSLVLFAAGGTVASAAPAPSQLPNTDCKEAPDPEFPGAGIVGSLDPPDGSGTPGSVYAQQGYAGVVWHTYDLGCGPDAAVAPDAVTDTWFGNILFDASKAVVALTVSVSESVSDNGLLTRLDDFIVLGSVALYSGVFAPLIGLVLLLLSAWLLVLVMQGRLSVLSRKVVYMLAGIGLASAAYSTPLLYIHTVDSVLVNGMSQIRSSVLGLVNVDEKNGLSDTLYQNVVWDNWLTGEFGSANSQAAQTLGKDLARAQAFSVDEVKAGATGESQVKDKKTKYEQVASRLSPDAYPYLTGKATSRLGTGAYAFTESMIYSLFQLMVGGMTFICLLLIRVLVLLGPVIGLLAIVRGQTLLEALRAGAAAVWHALFLTVMGLVHLASMVAISSASFGTVGTLLLMTTLTLVLWRVAGPWHRFRSMMTATGAFVGAEIPAPAARSLSVNALWDRLRSQTNVSQSTVRTETVVPHVSREAPTLRAESSEQAVAPVSRESRTRVYVPSQESERVE